MPPGAQPPARWERLIHEGVAVGYRREMGQTVLYSKDGYGWSGATIEHDARHPDTRLRDVRRGRVFHGDIVRMPRSAQRPILIEAVVLVHPEFGTLLWQAGPDRTHALDALWPAPQRPSNLHIVGHVSERPRLAERVAGILAGWRPVDPDLRLDSTRLALSSVGGAGAALAVQLLVTGAAGPIATWLGALVGAVAWFWPRKRLRPGRGAVLGAAATGAFKAGLLSTALFAIALFAGLIEVKHRGATLVVLAIASTFGAGVAHVLAGDLVVWRGGGYGGEGRSG